MDVSSLLNGSNASSPSRSGSSGGGFSGLTAEEFTKIVLTELSKQDPLQPNDSNALLQQLSTIRSIQSDMDLSSSLQSLVQQNDFASASTLIGRTVSGVSVENERVVGQVESVARTADGTFLRLQTGQIVPFANVDRIDATASTNPTNPSNPAPPTSPAPTTPPRVNGGSGTVGGTNGTPIDVL